MFTREEIIQALSQLDPVTFEEVIRTAVQGRDDAMDAVETLRPDLHASPEAFAAWLARRHMTSDAAIERVVYLPDGAPENEIRLLEVNRFLHPAANDEIEPLDFTPDVDGFPFKVLVADVASDQWQRIRDADGTALPHGWSLVDHRIYCRG